MGVRAPRRKCLRFLRLGSGMQTTRHDPEASRALPFLYRGTGPLRFWDSDGEGTAPDGRKSAGHPAPRAGASEYAPRDKPQP